MKKILLSAFACNPSEGSESGYGWNWAMGLASKGYEVHCLTRIINKPSIITYDIHPNLHFHFVKLPFGFERLFNFSNPTMYMYYILWQWYAYKKGDRLNRTIQFDISHHVTWGSLQMGSYLYKLNIPFIFGPAGGGQKSPIAFKKYFGNNWEIEKKREKVSKFLTRFNPAYTKMINKASTIWVSNLESLEMVSKIRENNVFCTFDAALSKDFFPSEFKPKVKLPKILNLLWIGRFMPRKGTLLLLDVMEKLKEHPGITLTLVGDGEDRAKFLENVKEKGLEKSVIWKGKVPYSEVNQFYSKYDAFFFTSLRDSCPTQLMEAMAYGMPIITLNLHGQSILVNNETGFRCSSDSPEQAIQELKDVITKLNENSDLFSKMSESAYALAIKNTWENKIDFIVKNSYPKF